MAVEIKVPDMGESVIEATVSRWLKQEGEPVKAGEPLVELETDKINLEVGAQSAGVLQKITRQAGETVSVGDVLGVVGAAASGAGEGDGGSALGTGAALSQPASLPAVDQSKAPAQTQASTQKQPETQTRPESKAMPAVQTQPQGQPQATQPTPYQAAAPITPEKPDDARGDVQGGSTGAVNATPLALRMAQDQGVDLRQVTPSGSGGRVTREDVETYLERGGTGQAPAPERNQPAAAAQQAAPSAQEQAGTEQQQTSAGKPQPAAEQPKQMPGQAQPGTVSPGQGGYAQGQTPTSDAGGPVTRIRMTRRRQTIAKRLVEAQQTAAMLTTFNEIDMSKVMELRKRRRESFKERFGVDLGFMSFFIKAVIGALKAFPNLNAQISSGPQGDEIVQKHYYDIGIAVGNEEGLVVPVIRGADQLNFAGVEKAVRELAEKARSGSLTLDELRGGTFTITNGGVYGSLLSTPILNPPQVGILGMHAIKERPVVIDGEIVARPMMYIALSYDHRIVDGSEAVRFLVRVKELVEDPESLLFG